MEKGNAERLSTGIGRKAWKQAGRKRREAPEEPPTGENGKKGKERTEGQVARTGTETDERKWKEREKTESESTR